MSEIELKFGVPDGAAPAVDRALRQLGARSQTIESRYWDTVDARLAAAHLALRLRKSGGRWEQTLKGPGPNAVERLEETVPRRGAWDKEGPDTDLSLHVGSEGGALLQAALTPHGAGPAPLLLVHRSVVRRRALEVIAAGGTVEIAFDRGVIEAGGASLPVCEVEIELKGGEPTVLIGFGRANADAHGMWLSTLSKAARGERLARATQGSSPSRAVKARPAALDREMSGQDIFRALVASCLEQVLANASVLAAGTLDDDAVHQLRVGLRRLRTAWRELEPWRGSLSPHWEAPAKEVFRSLGEYRDRHSIAAAMQQHLATAGSPDPTLRPAATGADIDPVALVRGAAFQHALLDLLAFVLAPPSLGEAGASALDHASAERPDHTIASRLDKLHARLKRDAGRFDRLDEPHRHQVRKRLKRLRYLSELVRPRYRGVGRFLKRLEPAQDQLGHYMDIIVATSLAHDVVAAGDTRGWFNVGWLKAQMPDAIGRCKRALRQVAEARPFWRNVDAR
ncbi:MAG: CHAD domain-containing protein [Caldimonas sp.]